MKRSRFSKEEIIADLDEQELGCRRRKYAAVTG